MDEFETLPDWAFRDCSAWQALLTGATAQGLYLTVLEAWRLDDGDATRGDNMMCLSAQLDGRDVGSVIVRGQGRHRFELWLSCPAPGRTPSIKALLDWAMTG